MKRLSINSRGYNALKPWPSERRQLFSAITRSGTWLMCILFILAATPFELAQSGLAYLLKIVAVLGIVSYAVVARGARIGRFSLLAMVVVIIFITNNLFAWTDRAVFATGAIVAGILLGQTRGTSWNDEFRVIVIVFLAVHCGGLLVAAMVFYGTGQVLELHNLVFPNGSRAEAYSNVGRLSGLHNEPGTYSQWTLMALYLLALMQRRLYSTWNALIALSVVLTISLWGVLAFWIFAMAFGVETLISLRGKQKVKALLSVLMIAGLVALIALNAPDEVVQTATEFLERKGEMNTQSGLDKILASEFMQREFWGVLVLGQPLHPGFCPECLSPQDSGIAMNGIYYLGFLIFACIFVNLAAKALRQWNIAFVFPLALLLVWKAHFYEPLLWIIIGYMLKGPAGENPKTAVTDRTPRRRTVNAAQARYP